MRFTDEEIHQLLNTVAPDGEDFRDMIVFGLRTGLRPQELRQLTRDQLIPDGAPVFILGKPALGHGCPDTGILSETGARAVTTDVTLASRAVAAAIDTASRVAFTAAAV